MGSRAAGHLNHVEKIQRDERSIGDRMVDKLQRKLTLRWIEMSLRLHQYLGDSSDISQHWDSLVSSTKLSVICDHAQPSVVNERCLQQASVIVYRAAP
jgi:hypothetical protein